MSAKGWSRTRLNRMREVTAGYVERGEIPGLVAILMTQRMWTSPVPPPVTCGFFTSAYQALDD